MLNCAICGQPQDKSLAEHISQIHGMDLDTYEASHGRWYDESINRALELELRGARAHPNNNSLRVKFAGVQAAVNSDVPADACLPLPEAYRIPEHGALAADVAEAAIMLARKRSMYIWGMPGSGKDALFHAWSSLTRTPAEIFQMEPGEDVRSWFYALEMGNEGAYWQEGTFLKALRDGYVSPISGRRMPMMILITDFDRAEKEQAEAMRLIMDSISGRVKGPMGVKYPVLPGTQIVVTANSSGGGDSRGRCVSSNPIDASILDRFQRALEFHWMDWKDEGPVVKEKFPLLLSKAPTLFDQVGNATAAIRTAIEKEELYTEFSHRAVCSWLGHAEDIVDVCGPAPDTLKRAFRVVADKMPDPETRSAIIQIIDPYLANGSVGKSPKKK